MCDAKQGNTAIFGKSAVDEGEQWEEYVRVVDIIRPHFDSIQYRQDGRGQCKIKVFRGGRTASAILKGKLPDRKIAEIIENLNLNLSLVDPGRFEKQAQLIKDNLDDVFNDIKENQGFLAGDKAEMAMDYGNEAVFSRGNWIKPAGSDYVVSYRIFISAYPKESCEMKEMKGKEQNV